MTEHEPEDLDPALARAVRALAEEDATWTTRPDVEAHLRREIRAIARTRRRRALLSYAGLAAAVILVAVLTVRRPVREAPPVDAGVLTEPPTHEVATAFMPLVYSNVPSTTAYLVRLELPRSALQAFGLESADAIRATNAPAMVLADVLVGEDGLARSIRFVQPQGKMENRR